MSDESANWNDLTRLWHSRSALLRIGDVEQQARQRRRQMFALQITEAGIMVLAFSASAWIAMQTAHISMSAIVVVFYAVCGVLQLRMRRLPEPGGGADLLSSLESGVAREEWNLAQLGAGRAVSFITLLAIVMVASNNLRHFAATPPARLWALLAIAAIVLAVLAGNLLLARSARMRKLRLESFALGVRLGPESKGRES
jgi:hypothetical protein